ncbi:MAG: SpoIIE family protein phosphatase [Pseudobdellovibrionaceae bacterium]
MKRRRSLSIRYKILLLLTLVPLVTLSLYLVMAVQVFQKDKLAYVFESGLSVARTLSSQASTEMNGMLITSKPAMQEFLLERAFGKVSQAIFDTEGQLEWMAAFSAGPTGFEKMGVVERVQGSSSKDLLSLGEMAPLLAELNSRDRLIRVPFKDDRILIMERVGRDATNPGYVFMMIGHLPELANSFRTASGEVYLVNEQGFVLFGPMGTESTFVTTKVSPDFVDEFKGKNNSGTKEVPNMEGGTLLASFSKTSFKGLTVVALVDRKAALAAVDDLLRRSLVFFLLLISASTVVSLFASGTLTSALTDLFQATKKVAEGNFDFQVQVRSNDEIGSLADSFNAMASEVSRLMGETAEKARMESELKTAQTVQETLFPPTRADMSGLRIAGYYEPASECGGDWWHYCQIENKIFLWIGDATGHGAPAALITSAAKSAATIIERLNVEPDHALALLNRAIYDVSKGRIMMTFFLASFDLTTHELVYANASHEAPFLIKKSDQPLKKKDLIPLNEVNNPRLGQDRETKYEQTKVQLDPGDRILFYTDGIPDIENPQKVAWGEREFIKGIISTNKDFGSISDSVDNLVHQFSEYRQKAPLKDDITFFMAHYVGDAT